jgi:DNA-binding CsgD family transcriptional regulator
MLDALDVMSCGGIVLDSSGAVIRMNARAHQYIGRGLCLRRGRLAARDRQSDGALQRLIGSVATKGRPHEHRAGGAIPVQRDGSRPLLIHAGPIVGPAQDAFQQGRAILMIVDPDEHLDPAEPVLQQVFGLTPAEARVAISVAHGLDVAEIALTKAVSEGPVRTQLKTIFAKTETRRQAQLVGLITRATPLCLAA